MVGGPDDAVERLRPLFEALAPPEGGYVHVGGTGAGHFTKMVHNGIEYALMQAYGEGFALLAAAPELGLDDSKLAEVAEAWRHGTVIRSWLLDLAALALADPSFAGVRVSSTTPARVGGPSRRQWSGVCRHRRFPLRCSSGSPVAIPTCSPTECWLRSAAQFGGHAVHLGEADGEPTR